MKQLLSYCEVGSGTVLLLIVSLPCLLFGLLLGLFDVPRYLRVRSM